MSSPPSISTPRFRAETISKSFPNVRALSDVTLDVMAGEVLALMGENGAGKSTFLKILGGDYHADTGQTFLDGQPLALAGPAYTRSVGIRVVHQEPDIVPILSVAENLFLGEVPTYGNRFVRWDLLNRNAAELLGKFRFGRDIDPEMPAANLTPAGRQMVEILRGLRSGLKVLALDEPTSSLSEAEAEDLFDMVGRLRADGVGILYVSHRMNEIFTIADRVAVLRDGHLVGADRADNLDQQKLISMMVGRELEKTKTVDTQLGPKRLEVSGLKAQHADNINFHIRAGEIVGFAGLVGAGRTELAKTLFGDLTHSAGEIRVDGELSTIASPSHAVRAGIAYVPEERKAEGLFPQMSVRENASIVVLGQLAHNRLMRRSKEADAVRQASASMRIKTPSLEQPISKLSGGNQQKVILARWLMANPKVIMLDEPTRGIDIGAKNEIYALIAQMAREGKAVMVISSELTELLAITHRIVCMATGRLVANLNTADTNEEEILHHCMVDHVPAQSDRDLEPV